MRDAQVAALTTRRSMMLGQLSAVAPGQEALYLELIVSNFDWSFWQYYMLPATQRQTAILLTAMFGEPPNKSARTTARTAGANRDAILRDVQRRQTITDLTVRLR